MLRPLRAALLLLVWGLMLFGTLQVGKSAGDWGHLCGPFGCGPPIKDLVAWHGFWMVVLVLPTWLCVRHLSARTLRRMGLALGLAGLLSLAGIVTWEAIHWLPQVSPGYRSQFVLRCLFVVALLVDLPIVQATLCAVTCWAAGIIRKDYPRSI